MLTERVEHLLVRDVAQDSGKAHGGERGADALVVKGASVGDALGVETGHHDLLEADVHVLHAGLDLLAAEGTLELSLADTCAERQRGLDLLHAKLVLLDEDGGAFAGTLGADGLKHHAPSLVDLETAVDALRLDVGELSGADGADVGHPASLVRDGLHDVFLAAGRGRDLLRHGFVGGVGSTCGRAHVGGLGLGGRADVLANAVVFVVGHLHFSSDCINNSIVIILVRGNDPHRRVTVRADGNDGHLSEKEPLHDVDALGNLRAIHHLAAAGLVRGDDVTADGELPVRGLAVLDDVVGPLAPCGNRSLNAECAVGHDGGDLAQLVPHGVSV